MSTRHVYETKRNAATGVFLFPLLFFVAGYTLWGIFITNGAFALMGQRVSQGILANGGPLRTVYTRIAPIDNFLTNMVFFTHPVTTEDFPLGKLFWTNFLAELAPVLAIMVAEEHVSPKPGRFLRSTAWLSIYQICAGAVVVPVYFLTRLLTPATSHVCPNGSSKAATTASALLPGFIFGYIIPLALVSCSFRQSPFQHQFWIGFFQMFPALIPISQFLSEALIRTSNVSSKAQPDSPTKQLNRLYLFMAGVSLIVHSYVTWMIVFDESLSLYRFYIPSFHRDDFAGCVLVFLQFDYAIVMASAWLAVTLESGPQSLIEIMSKIVMGLIIGPGAMLGFQKMKRREGKIHALS